MSELIFPKHDGVLVDDDARVVKTVIIQEKRHSYVVEAELAAETLAR